MSTYATVCIDYRGKEIVELISSLVTLVRVDPRATVHIMVNRECREMLQRAPIFYPDTFTVVYDDRIDRYLQLTDKEINEQGLVVEYYSQMFDFLRGILTKTEGGVHYFGAGCLFLKPPASYDKTYDYVGVNGTDGAFLGDFFYVRSVLFVDEWQEHIMKQAESIYDGTIEDTIVKKRAEWVRVEKARREAEKAKDEAEDKEAEDNDEVAEDKDKEAEDKDKDAEDKDKEAEDKDKEAEDKDKDAEDKDKEAEDKDKEDEDEPQVPDDFDDQMRSAYRLYATVDALKRKFSYVRDVVPEVFKTMILPDEAYINPTLFFRKDDKLEFEDLKTEDDTIVYKGEPVRVMRKLVGQSGAEHLNAPIHKIVSLFANDHPANQHLLTLASGQKIMFHRAYDEEFTGYKPEPYFQSELFELMEVKNQAFVTSKYLLYPCDSVGGTLQVYSGDDDSGLLLPYLSGKVHTFVHYEPSDATKAAYEKFNPGGWSKHLKCPERPRLLHKVLALEQTQKERSVVLYEPPHEGARVCITPKPVIGQDPSGGENEENRENEENEENRENRENGQKEEAAYEEHVRSLLDARFTLVHATHQIAEAMACGSVPVLAPLASVDTEGYRYPIREGVHYLKSEGDIERLGVGAETTMREAGLAYYEAHCSPDGFFRALMVQYFGLV